MLNLRTISLCLVMLTAAPGHHAEAASPIDEAISALKSLFSNEESSPPGHRAVPMEAETASGHTARPMEAETAYEDAVRLRAQGANSEALERLTDAANAGHAAAAYELGMLYVQGRELGKDLDLGAAWINRSADLGDARAQFLVGANLMSGTGVARNPTLGVAFLARAGEQGHVRAQHLLGQAYMHGIGVTSNSAWAARWYGRAARAGHAGAQYTYGLMHESGLGVPGSHREAYRWLSLAASNGEQRSRRAVARVAATLRASTVTELNAQATQFSPRVQARLNDVPTVMFVQLALNGAGYDAGPVDGLMGSRTQAGIRAFQHAGGTGASGTISNTLLQRLIERSTRRG